MPYHTSATNPPKVEERRAELWRFVEEEFGKESKATPSPPTARPRSAPGD